MNITDLDILIELLLDVFRMDKVSIASNRQLNGSPDSLKAQNYNDALASINQAQKELQLQSPSILQRTQQQLNEQPLPRLGLG